MERTRMRIRASLLAGRQDMSTRQQQAAIAVIPCLALVLAALVTSGCHRGDCGTPSAACTPVSSPTPSSPLPAVKSVVLEASIPSLPVDYVAGRFFSITGSGAVDVTVDWTLAEDRVHVWLAKGQCTFEQFEADSCQYLTQSQVSRPKPRILSVPAVSPGTYTLIVANWGPNDESLSYQVVLTSGPGASASRSAAKADSSGGFLEPWRRR
jgi:hypothetical protein